MYSYRGCFASRLISQTRITLAEDITLHRPALYKCRVLAGERSSRVFGHSRGCPCSVKQSVCFGGTLDVTFADSWKGTHWSVMAQSWTG